MAEILQSPFENIAKSQKTMTRSAFQNGFVTLFSVATLFWNAERVVVFCLALSLLHPGLNPRAGPGAPPGPRDVKSCIGSNAKNPNTKNGARFYKNTTTHSTFCSKNGLEPRVKSAFFKKNYDPNYQKSCHLSYKAPCDLS